MGELPPTRAKALSLGLTHYFTGRPCKRGHVAKRYAKNGHCLECQSDRLRKWNEDNPGRLSDLQRKWTNANRDRVRELYQNWRASNLERARELARNFYRKRRAANPKGERERSRKRRAANPEKWAAFAAARRARKRNATPAWADMDAIKAIYAERARISAETGIEHHVDHILPLRGRSVCGLHVETNLRVITAAENMAKGNCTLEAEDLTNGDVDFSCSENPSLA